MNILRAVLRQPGGKVRHWPWGEKTWDLGFTAY